MIGIKNIAIKLLKVYLGWSTNTSEVADYAENYVKERLQQVVKYPTILKEIIKAINKKKRESIKPLKEELRSITTLIEKVEGKRNKYQKLYENNLIDETMIIDRLHEIRKERDSLLKRRAEIEEELGNNTTEKLDVKFVRKILEKFNDLIDQASFEQQKMLMQLIIRGINVNEEKKIEKINLAISEQLQADIMQHTLSENSSDRAFSIYIVI
jgi:site-specific DNA recombinase